VGRVRACFAVVLGLALTGCSSNPVTPLPDDAGTPVGDSSGIVDASMLDRAPIPDGVVLRDVIFDAPVDVTEVQLAAPTFTPPPPATFAGGSTVAITPPPGFPANGFLFYSTNGQPPTSASPVYVAPIQINQTETLMAYASVPGGGYLDSPIATGVYTVEAPCGCALEPVTFSQGSESTEVPFFLALSSFLSANICYTTDGTAPTCSTTTGSCTGGSLTYAGPGVTIGPAITGPGGLVTITAIACAAGLAPSPSASQNYALLLAPPYLASQNSVGAGLPGWDWSGTGKPFTTMSIPGDAGVPYGPFAAQQVGLSCTSATSCSVSYPLADFVCWSTTGPATCSCANPVSLTAAAPSATLPASADVSSGGTLSVIACQASTPVNAVGFYGASGVTTVQF